MDFTGWFVRFLHIFSGVMWVGGLFLWGMVIAPSLAKRLGPEVRGPFMGVIIPRISRYFGIAGFVTVITGFWTMGLIWGWDDLSGVFQRPGYGTALGAGVVAAFIMLGIAYGLIIPSGKRMLELAAKMPPPGEGGGGPPPEMVTLQKRLAVGTMANLLLGTIALGVMAWATHLGG